MYIEECGIDIGDVPIHKSGAVGPIMSVYFRDPDCSLIEASSYP